jgi:hypothetical protein
MLSQLLTLYTTPVIYLFFDSAARKLSTLRFVHKKAQNGHEEAQNAT